ncbi:MAG: FtsX-like permease family protein [Planctomycetota bacterium]
MLRFALKTLLADRGKLLTALVGVIFSLVLVNVQGGLFLGLIQKASLLVDHCDADIWVGHRGLENADFPDELPETWLNRIRGLDGVERAEPYIVGPGTMTLTNGEYEEVWVIGSDPVSMIGSAWSFAEGGPEDLHRPHGISVEAVEAWKLGNPKVGDLVEINDAKAKVVAITQGIVGFLTTPYVFTTLESARTFTLTREGFCSYFLVKAKPNADVERLRDEIQALLPKTDVHTAAGLSRTSRVYWMLRTGIGISFGTATILGLLVGLVMVAQSLYALALDHLTEYATLKAIGAEDGHVYRVLLIQAITIAVLGIVLGVCLVFVIQAVGSTPYAPIEIPPWLLAGGIVLVLAICLFACVLPFRRIRTVDPATALQG